MTLFLEWSKFKVLADGNINVTGTLKFVFGLIGKKEKEKKKKKMTKGENAGYQHFLLFKKCFQKPSSSRLRFYVI